jgi:hypothetical protein
MAQPSVSSVTIDGNRFDALSVHFGVGTSHDFDGMPAISSLRTVIEITADAHDTDNLPFNTVQALYQLASIVTRDKIKDMKIEFWRDETQLDAICTWTFRGWLSNFAMTSGSGSNHILSLSLQPELDQKQFVNIVIGN